MENKVITLTQPRLLSYLFSPTKDISKLRTSHINNITKMVFIMREYEGVGLAANQVGWDKSVILIVDYKNQEEPVIKSIINPRIIWTSKEIGADTEGCLSLPGKSFIVERPEEVEIEYIRWDQHGSSIQTMKRDGMTARIIQHEIDHLNGVLISDGEATEVTITEQASLL